MLSVARRRNPAVGFTEGNFLDSRAALHDRWDLVTCMWYAYGIVNDMAGVEKLIRNLADWTAPTGTCFLPLADPRLISGVQLPYEVDHPQGKIRIDGILWSFIEDDGAKQHTYQLAPNLELMIEFFDRYFSDVRVEIYPQPPRRLPGLALLRHPSQLDEIRNNVGLMKGAVEEMLRHESPVQQSTFRVTTKALTIGGVEVHSGWSVIAIIGIRESGSGQVSRPGSL